MTMTPERWREVKARFDDALARPDDERQAWLVEACAGDPVLLQEVESLLVAHGREPGRFEVGPPLHTEGGAGGAPAPGTLVGPWRLVREIGRGGMGVVFEASRDDEDFRKRVAVKTVSPGLDAAQVLRRFRRERQILARLEHRNIAALYDGGVTPEGRPYFVMELVEGLPITSYAESHQLDIPGRLRLFGQVCNAVQYAHQALIVHRDLKPGNILVAEDGTVKLLDFGIAKPLREEDDSGEDGVTQAGSGTPLTTAYASPEQVGAETVTTATDIFSMGVVLYQLLAGRHPFAWDQPGGDELRRRIREMDPPPPGAVAGGLLSEMPRTARHELDCITMMALRKEQARRYPSAERLGEDLRRHLAGLPVEATPDDPLYRARKFVRRNRAAVVGACAVLATLVGGIIATTGQARVARAERDRAQAAALRAEQVSEFLQLTLGVGDPSWYSEAQQVGPQTTLGQLLEEAGPRAEKELADFPAALADVMRTVGRANQALRRTQEAVTQLERARSLHVALLGQASVEVAKDEHELGMAHNAAGDFRQAEAWLRRSLESFRAAGDSTSDEYGRTLADLGTVLSTVGRPAEAEPFVRAAAVHRWNLDSSSVANAILLGNLGLVLSQQGKLVAAESVYRRALAAFDGHAREYFEKGFTLGNLAVDLILRGRPADAEPLARAQVAHFGALLGEAHVATGYGWVNLARALHALGELAGARSAGERAGRIFGAALPPDHPDHARSETILGQVAAAEGRAAEAERRLRRALAIRQARLAPGSPHIADVKAALGELLAASGRAAEAEGLLAAAAEAYAASLDASDPRVEGTARRLRSLRASRSGGGSPGKG